MNNPLKLRHFLSKHTLSSLSRLTSRSPSILIPSFHNLLINGEPSPSQFHHHKPLHSSPEFTSATATSAVNDGADDASDDEMNEFLSRFVNKMRGNLTEAYPNCDKPTIDAMLVVIVDKLVDQMEKGARLSDMDDDSALNDDLWVTVKEASNAVYSEMEREKKKEKMKKFLQSEKVKEMARFASEVGVRGDMLRELRFKWAREAMETSEFYEELHQFREEIQDLANENADENVDGNENVEVGDENGGREEGGGLPKRHGRIKYKLYGLDMSGVEWKEVSDRIHEAEEVIWPQEAKAITGKCKLVTEKILGLRKDDDFTSLLDEWAELLQPGKVDWACLLEKLEGRDKSLYLKVAEHLLREPSFRADIRDYSKLIADHANERRLEDAERILKKMSEDGLSPDIMTLTSLVHMYSKAGNLERAKEAFEALRSQGFKQELQVYSSMIMAYVNANEPKLAEALLKEMDYRDIKVTEETYLALLRAFAQRGDIAGAMRIESFMKFAGIKPSLESCTSLVEACEKSGNSSDARNHFDLMLKFGYKHDDRCTALMIAAYQKQNELDKALNLLLELEKDGFQPGVYTYSVLVDWLGQLELVDEAEQVLGKISQLGEAPPFEVHVSLCDMYSRTGNEKKALQALGVLEAKKDLLNVQDFERVIRGLVSGGFVQEAWRVRGVMEAQGLRVSDSLNMHLMSTQAFSGIGGSKRSGMR